MIPIPETKDISETERKTYCMLPFRVVWNYWYKQRQGDHELLSDRYLLCWLKEHSPDTYSYMQGLLEQWYDRRITSAELFTEALVKYVTMKGLLSIKEDEYISVPKNNDSKEGGCKHCYIPGRVPRCSSKNDLLYKG